MKIKLRPDGPTMREPSESEMTGWLANLREDDESKPADTPSTAESAAAETYETSPYPVVSPYEADEATYGPAPEPAGGTDAQPLLTAPVAEAANDMATPLDRPEPASGPSVELEAAPDASAASHAPEAPEPPGVTRTLGAVGTPRFIATPEAPRSAEAPGVPEFAETSEVGVAEVPEASVVAEAPGVLGAPGVAGTPEASQASGTADAGVAAGAVGVADEAGIGSGGRPAIPGAAGSGEYRVVPVGRRRMLLPAGPQPPAETPVRALIGEELRTPTVWCELEPGTCISWHADREALGLADVRDRAIAAGWRVDGLGRLTCPQCQQTSKHFRITQPPVPWNRAYALTMAAREAARQGNYHYPQPAFYPR